MIARFRIRDDRYGWTVYDVWTGEPVALALTPATGLSAEDAAALAAMMNQRARRGDRVIPQ